MHKVLVTGAAGFIGFHLTKKLTGLGFEVVGIDAVNDYYDPNLKYDRLQQLGIARAEVEPSKKVIGSPSFSFYQLKLEDKDSILSLFEHEKFDFAVNLAAQAG